MDRRLTPFVPVSIYDTDRIIAERLFLANLKQSLRLLFSLASLYHPSALPQAGISRVIPQSPQHMPDAIAPIRQA